MVVMSAWQVAEAQGNGQRGARSTGEEAEWLTVRCALRMLLILLWNGRDVGLAGG